MALVYHNIVKNDRFFGKKISLRKIAGSNTQNLLYGLLNKGIKNSKRLFLFLRR